MEDHNKKHEKQAARLFLKIWLTAVAILTIMALCSRPTAATGQTARPLLYQDSIPPGPHSTLDTARRACDTLIDRTTGQRTPIYNCPKVIH